VTGRIPQPGPASLGNVPEEIRFQTPFMGRYYQPGNFIPKRITTMTYARVHDQSMADDYYLAMGSIEKRLALMDEEKTQPEPLQEDERTQILAIAHQLAQPEVSYEARQELVSQICVLLTENTLVYQKNQTFMGEQVFLSRPPPF